MAMAHVRTDVVIVGGGPVGLLLAAELAGHGVRTVVVEQRAEVSGHPRATTLHARTGQILARRGHLPAPARPLGEGSVSTPFHFAGVWGLDLSAPATEPEPLCKRPQAELERLFEARALAAGAQVLRRHKVTGLDLPGDRVTVRAEHPGGQTELTGSYVVGADGARSIVRSLSAIPCDATPPTMAALVGVVRCDGEQAPEPGWHRTRRGWVVAKRTADGLLHLRAVDCLKAPADHTLPLGIEEFRREMSRIMGRELVMDEPRWLSRFSDFSRLARTYRSGRVLLAGDAAHLHFPIGAQGLSTGLLDALDLGWKLAFTVRGAAAAGLLDSYDAERRPAAARLLEQIRVQADLMRPGRTPDSLEELAALMDPDDSDTEAVLGRIGLMVSGQDTVLPPRSGQPCAWEGQFLTNRELSTDEGRTDVIGLLRDGRMLLLRFGSAQSGRTSGVPHALRHVLREVYAEPVAGWPRAALLLRPDGYVAWGTDTAADLDGPLARWLELGGSQAGGAQVGGSQAEAPASSASSASAWTSA